MKADASAATAPARAGDPWTIVAITAVVYAMGSLLHEGLGHGGACLVSGGHPLQLTTVYFDCSRDTRLVDAGGTLVNFAAGFFAWAALRRWPGASLPLRFFLWLTMTVNLMEAGGYFLYSGIGNIGDWAAFIHGLSPAWAWRAGLTVTGVVLYLLIVWLAARELRPLLPAEDWIPAARRLSLIPYFAGGLLACIAGAFNPQGMILVAISAAAATFGGHSGLLWMPFLQARHPGWFSGERGNAQPLGRSRGWLAAGAIVAFLFVFVLGRGVSFY